MTERDEQVRGASGALIGALRKLHLAAGEPSSRAIASGVGGMSHTTVNSALKGPRVPSWPVLAKLVSYLEGDIEEFRELWIATREAGEPTEPLPIPASQKRGDVSVFLSYARVDDSATYGRILKIADDIANTYRSITGRRVGIFKDKTSIAPGEVWRERIQLGLASSSILLVFVTPAYLRSAMCREELAEFLNFARISSSSRIVIPLLYSSRDRIEKHFSDDEMWQELNRRNRVDISNLRSSEPGSSGWIEAVEDVADRIDEVLSSFEDAEPPAGEDQLVQIALPSTDEDEPGLLEKLADVESSASETTADIVRLSVLMNSLTEEVRKATPRMQRANSFAKRLGASNSLAKAIEPIADEMALVANRLHDGISKWSLIVDFAVNAVKDQEEEDASSSANTFLATIETLATTGTKSLSSIEGVHAAIEKGKGYSGHLDRPLSKIQDAILQVAELRGLFNSWRSEIESLRSVGIIG